MIENASNQTLKRSYKQRIIMNNDKIIAKEPPWINAQIRSGIKKRKQLNRENLLSDIVKLRIKKKQWKNILIKRRRYKLTYMMQCNAMQTIDKLRGKSTILYDCDGKLLSKEEADTEIEEFWKNIYQKHENNIEEVWNSETRKVYQ